MKKNEKVGPVKTTSLVVGNMIGSGVLLAPAILAPYGSMSIVGWILTTIGAIALAMVFSYLSRWIPRSGGPYTFARHVFGDFVGFQMAWGYWISAWCGSASLLIGGLQYMSIFFPELVSSQAFSVIFGVVVVAIFTLINMRGMKESMFVAVIIVVLKVLPLVIIGCIGIFFVDFSNFSSISSVENASFASLGAMAPTLLWAFLGLESATIPADNVENPDRTIPLATILGVLITASIYICGAIVIFGMIPHEQLVVSQAPYVDAARKIFGEYGALVIAVAGIIGIYGSLNGWILIQGQVPYSASEEGLFPKFFMRKNKYGAPRGVLVGSVLMLAVFLLTYQPTFVEHVKLLIDVSVLAMLLPYFYSAIAFCYLAVMKKKQLSSKEKVSLIAVGFVSVLYTFCAIFASGAELVFISTVMFLISVPCYCFTKRENRSAHQAAV